MNFDWRLSKLGNYWVCILPNELKYQVEPVGAGFINDVLTNCIWRCHCSMFPYLTGKYGYIPKDLRRLGGFDRAALFASLEDAKKHCEHHYRTLVLQ